MALSKDDWRTIHRIARSKLGHESLRPGQAEALRAVLEGHDTLAVLPTGSGKSAIYQIAALMIPGPTVVVSPLIALQRDQLEAIEATDLGPAAVVHSKVPARERKKALDELEHDDLEFLFLAPEQLSNAETYEHVKAASPSLFVVDEAHCISEWGHDFRPDYLKLGAVIESLGHPRTLALTATAAPEVRQEIVERLRMRDPRVIVTGFDRPNIWLGVSRHPSVPKKRKALVEAVLASDKPGIVYAATRKSTEAVAADLAGHGVRAVPYHAGLKKDEREANQTAFMSDEVDVMVATTAFGMGIDKPNVRFVFHHDLSDSLDAYYQEIGRAGRDGEPARAVLFYTSADVGLRRFFASGGKVDESDIEHVAQAIRDTDEPVAPKELRGPTALSQAKITKAVARLEEVGVVETLPTGEVVPSEHPPDLAEAVEAAAKTQEERREADRDRVERMRIYAEITTCRRAYLLDHFGEKLEGPCARCDVCERPTARPGDRRAARGPTLRTGRARATRERPESPTHEDAFPTRARVRHRTWGEGTVVAYDGEDRDRLVVDFDGVGTRRLSIAFVERTGLLERIP